MIKHPILWSLALGVTAAAAAEAPPSIDRLAPDNSVLIISVDNFQEALTRFQKTHMWALWQSEQSGASALPAAARLEWMLTSYALNFPAWQRRQFSFCAAE